MEGTMLVPVVEVTLRNRKFYLEMTMGAALVIQERYGRDIIKDMFWTPEEIVEKGADFLLDILLIMFSNGGDESIPPEVLEFQQKLTKPQLAKYIRFSEYPDVLRAIMRTMYVYAVPEGIDKDTGENPQTPATVQLS